jgi:hypothetical protein
MQEMSTGESRASVGAGATEDNTHRGGSEAVAHRFLDAGMDGAHVVGRVGHRPAARGYTQPVKVPLCFGMQRERERERERET